MNYDAGKFDAAPSLNGQGSHPADGHVDSVTATAHGHVPAGAFVVPDAQLLFHGDFKRSGVDLVLSKDGDEFVVHEYFKGEKRAPLSSPDGAYLTGDIVNALTGHVQYAQAAPTPAAAQVIGHVTKLTGSATVVRNGVSIILNNGDNVEKGDAVATGSDSTLGITFIDGTVFGLSSNARMVLNEMVYDPNGSNNSSLLSLVAGTITFVAGETAKHGDMKVDTPVATMGIRGTAVLTEISFVVPAGGGDAVAQANFQVLVEPDGTTGSYILFDKTTLLPIATVNDAGKSIKITGNDVSISNALVSPDVQKLISDVFSLKFTDNTNQPVKLTNNSIDTITQLGDDAYRLIRPNGATADIKVGDSAPPANTSSQDKTPDKSITITHIPGKPETHSFDASGTTPTIAFSLTERADTTGDNGDADFISGIVRFADNNQGDRPTTTMRLADQPNYLYKNAAQQDVTAQLSDLQKHDIAAAQVNIIVVSDPNNTNTGRASWTYQIPDSAFDFLGAGETLTLTYIIRVDNNFAPSNEFTEIPITITITGTNDRPVITSGVPTITFSGGTSVPGGPLTSAVPTTGTLTFTDVDLTDKHAVTVELTGASLPGGIVPPGPLQAFAKAMSVNIGTDSTGTGNGIIDWTLADLPVYLADFIPKGQVLTLTYTVTVDDGHGGTSTQTITVTIKGTDSPAVVWIATTQAGSPGGFWKDAANWATGTVPTSNDDVIVITDQLHGLTPSYPVTIDQAAFAKSVTMNDFGGPPPEIDNKSTLTISGALIMRADSILNNFKNAQISVGGAVTITGTSSVANAGTLKLAAGGTIDTHTTITNSGLIDLTGGTLTLTSNIANAGGTLQADLGSVMTLHDTTITGGKVVNNSTLNLTGNVVLKGGTLNNTAGPSIVILPSPENDTSGTVVVVVVHQPTSTITGLTISGTGNSFDNETVTNSGLINVVASSVLTLDQGTTVANTGIVAVEGNGKLIVNDASINGAGSVANGGEIDLTGAAVLSNGHLGNAGSINVSGAGNALDHETVVNGASGTIEVLTDGALTIGQGSTVANSGNVIVDSDAELVLNDATVSGGVIKGAGTIDVTGDSTIDSSATLSTSFVTVETDTTLALNDVTVSGTAIIDNGTVKVDASKKLTLNGASLTGGKLVVSGTLDSTGATSVTNTDITNNFLIEAIGGLLTLAGTPSVSIANDGAIRANGAELDISGELIVNTGTLEAISGGTLKLSGLTVTNLNGSVVVDGTSKLYLTKVSITDGNLDNAGHLYGVADLSAVTAAVTNTGTIEVQGGTLDLAGGITGKGTLIVDDGATLALGGADAQTVTFAGGSDTLRLDNVAGHAFTGTITGKSSTGGTFTVTGGGNITSTAGDALDFTASGGTVGASGDVVLTPTGALKGAANGVVVTQNGVGDISLTATGDITGLAGNGITLTDGATGVGDITITNLTGKATGTGAGSAGIFVSNLNSANGGDITITQLGGATGAAFGIDAATAGSGDVTITTDGTVTGATGLAAFTNGGKITVANDGDIAGTSGFGIDVSQATTATGLVHITNDGGAHVTGVSGAISIAAGHSAGVLIDNSGTIGPDGVVLPSTLAITATGGPITINNYGDINGNLTLGTATFNNHLGGTWTVAGSSVFGSLSSIFNYGVIDLLDGAAISGSGLGITNANDIDSWGTTSISGTITNNDLIEVKSGTLTLFGSLSGSGSVTIDHDATLKVWDSVSQTVTFAGANAELEINTSSFGGSIAGLAISDKLDLSSINYGLGTYATYVSNAQHTGGVLTVTDANGHSIALTLVGDYSNTVFAGQDDGTGHTLITLNAADDAPHFNAAEASQSAAVAELADTTGSSATDPSPAATGTIHFTDVDLTDLPAARISGQTVTWTDANNTTDLSGSLTLDEIAAIEKALTLQQDGNHNNGAIGWTYSIADSALDFLGEGQTIKLVATITLDDGRGGTDTAQITIIITGKNDAPAITAETGDSTNSSLTETDAGRTGSGTLTLSDADVTDHVTVAVDHVDVYLGGVLQSGSVGGLSNATLLSYLKLQAGDILNGTGTHAHFTWNFDSNGQAFDFLAAGQKLSLQYTIVPNDGHAPAGTGGTVVTIDITGSNDAPSLDGATLASVSGGDFNPAGTSVADLFAGKFHDADNGASLKAIAVTADHATAGQGVWQYQVAGSSQWIDISGVSTSSALVLGPDTLIRFVPAANYNGTPGALDVHALDDTYGGSITTATPALIDASNAGGTTPISAQPVTIGTEVTVPTTPSVYLTGLDGNGDAVENTAVVAHIIDPNAPAASVITYKFEVFDADRLCWVSVQSGNSNTYTPTSTHDGQQLRVEVTYTDLNSQPEHFIVSAGTVHAADQPPTASPVTLANGTEDHAYTISAADLLAGVTDPDGPSLSITALSVKTGGGTLTDNHDGTWTYTPAANYNGPVSFDYTASDGTLSASSTASLTLKAVDDAPVAVPVTLANGTEDHAYTISAADLLTGVTDIDGPSLSITAVSIKTGGGTLTDNHDGTWTYTPAANYNGPVSFDYTASDGTLSSSSTASLTLNAEDDAPVASPVTLANGTEDHAYTISAADLLTGVTDIDGPSLSVTALSVKTGGGTLVDNHDGTWTYTPEANYNGLVSFDYTASDGSLTSSSTASLVLAAVNDAPTGAVTIDGTFQQAKVLTANTTTLADADGLGTLSYQWQRDGVDISQQTGKTYALTSADVGHTIDVVVHYTDGGGTAESVKSANTPSIAAAGIIAGDSGDNTLTGTPLADSFQGFGGNDTIIGLAGVDRAIYTDATGGITVDMAAGTVTGAGVGTDTLIGIEQIQGSNFADHYTATGFTGDSGVPGVPPGFNSFEGMAGDDIITGNVNIQGQALTRISYLSATGSVTVNLGTGVATGDASVGTDHFTNVNAVLGSNFDDTLIGSDNPSGTYEQFEGRGGNDLIEGGGGYDFAVYNNDPTTTSGITVHMAAGTVAGDASIGTDTLRNVEGVRGTNFADTYDATGFSGTSTNAGSLGTFNNFDGAGGDDTIIGNGNTRIQYSNATAGVNVNFITGIATGDSSVGTDHFSGVNAVMGSMFDDTFIGSNNNETFQGLGGNDFIDGGGGFDIAQYNNATYTTGGVFVHMATGIVVGDASNGTDTLRSIEGIQGTAFADTYDATNFGAAGYLDPNANNVGSNGTFNQFEGLGGDDTIIGNGNTRIVYSSANAGVTINMAAGTANGDASVGHDTFTGVNSSLGSNFADVYNAVGFTGGSFGPFNQFEGRGGDDQITGNGSTAIAYTQATAAVTIHMQAGTADGDSSVGHDTFTGVNYAIGSNFNDIYDATGFTGGNFGPYNQFQGGGGDDQIIGNGYTQLVYYNATGGITADIAAGTVDGDASVGHDTFTGVNGIQGSNFNDTLRGGAGADFLAGGNGDDVLDGRGGNDFLTGGAGADTFVYGTNYGADTVLDFHHGEGDKIDLRGIANVHALSDLNATQSGSNTIINFGGGNTLTLAGVTLANLTDGDFIFSAKPVSDDWTGRGDGASWTDPNNWSLLQVPTSSNVVNVDANGTVNLPLSSLYSIAELHVFAGTDIEVSSTTGEAFMITGSLSNAGTINLTNAWLDEFNSFTNSGIITANSGAVLNFSNLSGLTIDNSAPGSALQALDGGEIDLIGATVNGGVIEANDDGSLVFMRAATIAHATLSTPALHLGPTTATFEIAASGAADVSPYTLFDGTDVAGSAAPVIIEATVDVDPGATLALKGAIENDISINLGSAKGGGSTLLIHGDVTLSGFGTVVLGNGADVITDDGSPATLHNGNFTSGTGTIGGANLTLINEAIDLSNPSAPMLPGFIVADGGLLVLDPGVFTNNGFVAATNGGTLQIGDVGGSGIFTNLQADPDHAGGAILDGGYYGVGDFVNGTAATMVFEYDSAITTLNAFVSLGSGGALYSGGVALQQSLLTIDSHGFLTLGGDFIDPNALDVKGGISLWGGSFDSAGLTIETGATFTGWGLLSTGHNDVIINDGLIRALGTVTNSTSVTLEIAGNIDGTGVIEIGGLYGVASTLQIDATQTAQYHGSLQNVVSVSGQTIVFDSSVGPMSTSETLVVGGAEVDSTTFGATITGFAVGDAIDLTGVGVANGWTFNGATFTLTSNGATIASLTFSGLSSDTHFTIAADQGGSGTTISIEDQPPVITGDLATTVVKGAAVKLAGMSSGPSADLLAVDPDNTLDHLFFTVAATEHGHLADANGNPLTNFTQLDLNNGSVFFVADDPSYVGAGSFTVTLSDGTLATGPTTVGVNIVDAQISIKTTAGFDFDQDDPVTTFGGGRIQNGYTDQTFTVKNAAADRDFVVSGIGLTFAGSGADLHVTGGTITSILEQTHDTSAPLVSFTLHVPAVDWMNAAIAQAQGNTTAMDALTGHWTFSVGGNAGPDNVGGGTLNDVFTGNGGNDTLDGGYGYDRAYYGNATGPINVQLAAGIVTGDLSVGTDTLKSIELVTGTNFNDTYNATGFGATSTNAGSVITANTAGLFNEFEGRGGDDTITGNGSTRISYQHATSGVTVTFNANSWTSASSGGSGTATGDASTGTDTFTGVYSVRGSNFDDTFHGSNNPTNSAEEFEGRGGNDLIDGGGGFDRARYDGAADGVGINVNLGAGIVTGGPDTGTDTLRSVEAIWGTNYADTYDASGFSTTSTNAGTAGVNGSGVAFNEFEGGGGNDTVTGNGNTRVSYTHANSGVIVTLGSGGSGDAYGDSSVGHDHFNGGVSAVRGSQFNDIITGNGGNNTLDGQGGNDVLRGLGGNDTLTGGTGADIFVYDRLANGQTGQGTGSGGIDTITDFNPGEGDRIDLRTLTGLTSFNQILANAVETGSGSTLKTTITFGQDTTTQLVLLGVSKASLTASDFILHSATNDTVAVTVQSSDGYDFSTLYTDMSVSLLATAANTVDHIFAVDAAKGITFELIGSAFSYDPATHQVTGGTINEIDILSGTDPSQTGQDHVLVNTYGWNIAAASFFTALGQFGSTDPSTHATGKLALDGIFGSAIYSYVGSAGGVDATGQVHDGADTFVGGNNADVFIGLGGPAGSLDPGHDTVDYSNAASGVSVNLLTGATSGTAAAGDVFISIENLRGSNFDDTLIGDGNDNVLEGGTGNNTIDGGGGNNTASYAHAASGVTVSLAVSGPQNTIGAGTDTLTNIANLTGSHFNDILIGNTQNNILMGNGGSDTFVFNETAGGIGHDTIGDFVAGQDHIQLDYAAFIANDGNSFNAWLASHVTTVNGNLLIDLNLDGKDTILLKNAAAGGLHANDFILPAGHG